MRLSILIAAFAFAACQKEPAHKGPALAAPAPQAPAIVENPPSEIDSKSWQTAVGGHPLLGAKLPSFAAKADDDSDISNETLRGRWTIIGFQSGGDDPAESRYIAALNSAVDQDPDLDFLFVYRNPEGVLLVIPPQWPSIHDGGKLARLMRVEATPFYFLIGPDLTIHAWRGALSSDPDGIKSVIRGVAEIRKRVAVPR